MCDLIIYKMPSSTAPTSTPSNSHSPSNLTIPEIEMEFCRLAARLHEMKAYAPKDETSVSYREYVGKVRKDLVSVYLAIFSSVISIFL